jgi:GxxExxY protein
MRRRFLPRTSGDRSRISRRNPVKLPGIPRALSERMVDDSINDVTYQIVGAAIEVHRVLGPGLLESAYEACMAHELVTRGIPFVREIGLPVIYKGARVNCGFRVDFIVDEKVVVEIKAVEAITPVHQAQVNTYLRLSGCKIGLLLNFNSRRMTDGIKRIIWDRACDL